jgi:hypothetical protein
VEELLKIQQVIENRENRRKREGREGGIPGKVKQTRFQSISVNMRRVWIDNL